MTGDGHQSLNETVDQVKEHYYWNVATSLLYDQKTLILGQRLYHFPE
jgi:hypothetical protein